MNVSYVYVVNIMVYFFIIIINDFFYLIDLNNS